MSIEVVLSRRPSAAVPPLVAAFWEYPETVHLLPDMRRRRRVLPRYLLGDCADAAAFGTLLVAEQDGTAMGAAAWLPPSGYPLPARRQLAQLAHLAPAAPWGLRALPEARRGQLAMRRLHPRDRHFYLRAIGVAPDHQRVGVGAQLMEPIFTRADAEGVGCYLTTAAEENVGWYTRFGFEVMFTGNPTARWPQVWAMWRPPPMTMLIADPAGRRSRSSRPSPADRPTRDRRRKGGGRRGR